MSMWCCASAEAAASASWPRSASRTARCSAQAEADDLVRVVEPSFDPDADQRADTL